MAQDGDNSEKQYWLNKGDSIPYHFENKSNKENFVKFREPNPDEILDFKARPYDDVDVTDWSSKFSTDDIEDFQTSIQGFPQGVDLEEEKEMGEDDAKGSVLHQNRKWYEPSRLNGYRRFVRVIITTENEATLFIMLCDPNMPEFRVKNYTNKKVEFYQKGVKERKVVNVARKAKTDTTGTQTITFPVPLVWDDQSSTDKKLIL